MKHYSIIDATACHDRLFQQEEARQERIEESSTDLAMRLEEDYFQDRASEILVNAIGCDALDSIDNAVMKALVLGGDWLNKPLKELLAGIDATKLESELRDYIAA